jgi:hypothetical protein
MNNDMEINDYSEMQRGKTFAKNTSAKRTSTKRKSAKKSKNIKSIPRKTMSVVEKDLKMEYQKYLNTINRRKLCKKKTFRQFVDDKIGKKQKRKSKKAKVAPEAPAPVVAAVEETPSEVPASVEPTPSADASVEETPSVEPAASVEPEVPASVESTPEESTSASPEEANESSAESSNEEKPKGIFDTITSALTPTEKPKEEEPNKTGGKRRKGCKGKGKGSRRSK